MDEQATGRMSPAAAAGRRWKGITLLELLVALATGALLASLAVPTFRDLMAEARMTAAVNDFIHGIHAARQAAARRHSPVVLCRSTDGRRCQPDAGPDSGWVWFANEDRDQPPQRDVGEPVLGVMAGQAGVRVAANRQAFVFRPQGQRAVNGTLVFCDPQRPEGARLVIVSYTGRPRSALAKDTDSAVKCPS